MRTTTNKSQTLKVLREMFFKAVKKGREADWEKGDTLLAIEAAHGTEHAEKACLDAGLAWRTGQKRMRVSQRFPEGHPIRETSLRSYSHYEPLSRIDDDSEALRIARLCEKNAWSVEELLGYMRKLGHIQNTLNAGAPRRIMSDRENFVLPQRVPLRFKNCYTCGDPLVEEDAIQSLRNGEVIFAVCSEDCLVSAARKYRNANLEGE